jgi:hypothetical protein
MRAPVLAVGDGALGFSKALREVFPATREQRCRLHKAAAVIDSMPKSAQPAAKKALQDIHNAEDRGHAEQAEFPKAVTKGAGSRAAGLAMVYKLVESAQSRWRAVYGAHLIPLVRGGASFERGQLPKHPETAAA